MRRLPFLRQRVGSHWSATEQIDVVAVNWDEAEVLYGECKWKRSSRLNEREVKKLIECADQVELTTGSGNTFHKQYVFFAREGFTPPARALADCHVRTVTFTLVPGRLTVEQLLNQVGEPGEVHAHVPRDAGAAARQCELLRLRHSQQNLEATLHESESASMLSGHSISRLYLAPTRPALSMMTPFYRRPWTGCGSYCITLDEVFKE